MQRHTRVRAATVVAVLGLLGVPAVMGSAGAATRSSVTAASTATAAAKSVRITSLPATAFTDQTFSVNGQITPLAQPVEFQVQISTPDHRAWRSLGTHKAVQYVVIPLHFTAPNTYSVRLAVLGTGSAAVAISPVKTVTVTPPYPYASLAKRTFTIRTDAKTEQQVTIGSPSIVPSVTSCSVANLPGSCVTDTPINGHFVVVPLKIHQVQGRSSFAPYLFVLTIGKRTFAPVVADTGDGATLRTGSARGGQTVKGTVVFDAPTPTGAKLSILDVKGSQKL